MVQLWLTDKEKEVQMLIAQHKHNGTLPSPELKIKVRVAELATLDDKLEKISIDPLGSTDLDQRIELLQATLSQLEKQVNELRLGQKHKAVALDNQRLFRISRAVDLQLDIIFRERVRLETLIAAEDDRTEKLAWFNQTFKERIMTEQAQCFTYMAEAGEIVDMGEIIQIDVKQNEKRYWNLLAKRDQTRNQAKHTEAINRKYIGHMHHELASLTKDNALLKSKVEEQRTMFVEQQNKIQQAKGATQGLLHSSRPESNINPQSYLKKQTKPKPKIESQRSFRSLSSRQSKELMEMNLG